MSNQEKKSTRSRDFDAEVILGPDATIGDKLKALRFSKKITLAALSRSSGLSDRAIRYIENNERQPGIDAIKKLSAALDVSTSYFMDDDLFQEEADKEEVLAEAKEKYGSRGKAQAERIYQQTQALFAGGQLSEEDRSAFRDLMIDLFFETKEEAKKYTLKKFRSENSAV